MPAEVKDPWWVYILRCADGTLYTGATKDIFRRLDQHNSGKASRYTRSRLPVQLLWTELHPDSSSAYRREAWIKTLPTRWKKKLIEGKPSVDRFVVDRPKPTGKE